MKSDKKDVMNPLEVADYLGISRQTVMREIHKGNIAASQLGRQYRIRRTAIDTYFNENQKKAVIKE